MKRQILHLIMLLLPLTTGGEACSEENVHDLARRLDARFHSMSIGNVYYKSYVSLMDVKCYETLRQLFTLQKGTDEEVLETVHDLLLEHGVATSHLVTIWYKEERFRIARENLKRVDNQGRTRTEPEFEEVAFDGISTIVLEDRKRLYYKEQAALASYPKVLELDVSLAPWVMVIRKGPAVGQTITVFGEKGLRVIRFMNHEGTDTQIGLTMLLTLRWDMLLDM